MALLNGHGFSYTDKLASTSTPKSMPLKEQLKAIESQGQEEAAYATTE